MRQPRGVHIGEGEGTGVEGLWFKPPVDTFDTQCDLTGKSVVIR